MAAIIDNVVACWEWRFNTLVDLVNSFTLTNNGGFTFAADGAGKPRWAADFEQGSAQYATLGDNATISMGDIDFSVSAWAKLESVPAGIVQMGICAKATSGSSSDQEYMLCYDEGSTSFLWRVGNGANATAIFSAMSASVDTWYHLVGTHDSVNNDIKLYVNGVLDNSNGRTGGSFDSTGDLYIGRLFGPIRLWDGLIGQVAIWKNWVLQPEQVRALYNSGSGLAYPFTQTGSADRLFPQQGTAIRRPIRMVGY